MDVLKTLIISLVLVANSPVNSSQDLIITKPQSRQQITVNASYLNKLIVSSYITLIENRVCNISNKLAGNLVSKDDSLKDLKFAYNLATLIIDIKQQGFGELVLPKPIAEATLVAYNTVTEYVLTALSNDALTIAKELILIIDSETLDSINELMILTSSSIDNVANAELIVFNCNAGESI